MANDNKIYDFLVKNNLTTKTEDEFIKEYSNPGKAQQLYEFFVKNNITKIDSASFYDTYLKKKEGTGLVSQNIPENQVENQTYQQNISGESGGESLQPQQSQFGSTNDLPINPFSNNDVVKNRISDYVVARKQLPQVNLPELETLQPQSETRVSEIKGDKGLQIEPIPETVGEYLGQRKVHPSILGLSDDVDLNKGISDKQRVDFDNKIKQAQEYEKGIGDGIPESYLMGSAKVFQKGIADLMRVVDEYSVQKAVKRTKYNNEKERIAKEGYKTVRELWDNIHKENAPEKTFLDKSADYVENLGGDWKLPNDILGNIAGGIAGVTPDLMTIAALPEMKVAQLAKYGIDLSLKFPLLLGLKESSHGKTIIDKATGLTKGVGEGLKYELFGLTGGEVGKLLKDVKGAQILSPASSAVASGVLFGTDAAISEYNKTGRITKENVLGAFGMGIAFGAKEIIKGSRELFNRSLQRKAIASYFTNSNEAIKAIAEMDVNPIELRKQSIDIGEEITKTNNIEEKNSMLLAKNIIDNIILTNAVVKDIVDSPEQYIKSIKNNPYLKENEKQVFINKINKTLQDTDTRVIKTRGIQEDINRLKERKEYLDGQRDRLGDETVNAMLKPVNEGLKELESKLNEEINKGFEKDNKPMYLVGEKQFNTPEEFLNEAEKYKGKKDTPKFTVKNDTETTDKLNELFKEDQTNAKEIETVSKEGKPVGDISEIDKTEITQKKDIKENVEKNAAESNLKEIRDKGFIRVKDPKIIAEKIKKHTGVELIVNEESGTLKLKQDEKKNEGKKEQLQEEIFKENNEKGTEVKKTKPEEPIKSKKLTDKQHSENIKTKFRETFSKKGVPKEQIEGAVALMEARANSWASKEKGRKPEQWYQDISDIKTGKFEPKTKRKYQLADGTEVETYLQGSVYSNSEKALKKITQNKGSKEQWRKMLLKNGSKEAELEWMEFDKLPDKITKKELEEWVNEHKVDLMEVVKKEPTEDEIDILLEDEVGQNMSREEAREYLRNEENAVKYDAYTLSGGENYKEYLIVMPVKRTLDTYSVKNINGRWFVVNDLTGTEIYTPKHWTKEQAEKDAKSRTLMVKENKGKYDTSNNYKSGHFDEPNIAVHIRSKEYTDAEGKRILVLQEIQSDHAEEGRKKGFKEKYTKDELSLADNSDRTEQDKKLFHFIQVKDKNGDILQVFQIPKSKYKTFDDAVNYIIENKNKIDGVPDMPFKNTKQWVSLALKRMVKEAIDNGFDKIGWTTGKQNADFYDLRKQIEEIKYTKKPKPFKEAEQQYSIDVYDKKGKAVIRENSISIDEISKLVGKEIADKISKEVGINYDNGNIKEGVLKNIDLEVGGEGMKGFYDNIVPITAKKLFKKYGVEVKESTINKKGDISVVKQDNEWVVFNKEETQIFKTEKEAKDYAKKLEGDVVHSFEITPALKEAMSEGMPMFQKDTEGNIKGAVETLANGKLVIHAMKSPDFSTMVHELAHVFEKDLDNKEKIIVKKFGGSEKFARGFERYLRTGKYSSKELKPLFIKFKEWLTNIYKTIKGSSIDIKITPEIKKIYDRLLIEQESKINVDKQIYDHNRLINEIQNFNSIPFSHNVKRNSIRNRINSLLERLGNKYYIKWNDSHTKLIGYRDGKRIVTLKTSSEKDIINSHKTLEDYDINFREFVNRVLANPVNLHNVEISYLSPKEKKYAINNVLNNKINATSNELLDVLESYYKNGEIIMKEGGYDKGKYRTYLLSEMWGKNGELSIPSEKDIEPWMNVDESIKDELIKNKIWNKDKLEKIKDSLFGGVPYTKEDYNNVLSLFNNEKEYKKFIEEYEGSETSSEIKENSRKSKSIGNEESLKSIGADRTENFERRTTNESKPFKLSDMVVEIIGKYAPNSKIIQGNTGKAIGSYNNKYKHIFLKGLNQISVAFHELSHAIDDAHGVVKNSPSELKQELGDVYLKFYPNAKEAHSLRKKSVEGYATLIQKYIEQPTLIKAMYPNLVNEYIEGERAIPKMKDMLKDANKMVADYQGLSDLEKMGSRMASEKLREKRDEGTLWGKRRRAELRVGEEVFDTMRFMEDAEKKAGTLYSAKSVVDNLRMASKSARFAIQNLEGSKSLNNEKYKKLVPALKHLVIGSNGHFWGLDNNGEYIKKYDYNWGTLVDRLNKRELGEEFGAWLFSRNAKSWYDGINEMSKQREMIENEMLRADDKDLPKLEATHKYLTNEINNLASIITKNELNEKIVNGAYEEGADLFKKEAEMYDKLELENIRLLEAFGTIDKKTADKFRSRNGEYAPLLREVVGEVVGENVSDVTIGNIKSKGLSSLKRMIGGTQPILNPLFSSINNHIAFTKRAHKDKVNRLIYENMLEHPDIFGKLFTSIPLTPVLIDGKVSGFKEQNKDDVIIITDEKGKKHGLKIIDKDIARLLTEVFKFQDIPLAFKAMITSARLFKAGTTGYYLPFMITNTILDTSSKTTNTKTKLIPFLSEGKEMAIAVAMPNSAERLYLEEYIYFNRFSQTRQGYNNVITSNKTFSKLQKQKVVEQLTKGINYFTNFIAAPSNISEIIPRATEYIRARKMGKTIATASEWAGRVTGSFHHYGRMGGIMGQSLIKGATYFNPALQTLDMTISALKTKEGRKRYAIVSGLLGAMAGSSIYTIMNLWNDDDKKKAIMSLKSKSPKELSQYAFYPNPYKHGNMIKVRMPETHSYIALGINMYLLEKYADANYTVREKIDGALSIIPDQLQPWKGLTWLMSLTPPLLRTSIEIGGNFATYPTVRPIETYGDLQKVPAKRFSAYTSDFSKWMANTEMGKKFRLSPKMLDHFIKGNLGRATGYLIGKPGMYNLADVFTMNNYVASTRQASTFFNNIKVYKEEIKDAKEEIKKELELKQLKDDDILNYYDYIKNPRVPEKDMEMMIKYVYDGKVIFEKFGELNKYNIEKEERKYESLSYEIMKDMFDINDDKFVNEKYMDKGFKKLMKKYHPVRKIRKIKNR